MGQYLQNEVVDAPTFVVGKGLTMYGSGTDVVFKLEFRCVL